MKTFAVVKIEDGLIVNCIVADNKEIADTVTNIDDEGNALLTPIYDCVEYYQVSPGWSYLDGQFVQPS
jgi:hypothetical protein